MRPWWYRLLCRARVPAGGLSLVGLLLLLGVGLNVLRPWPMKLLVDHVLARKPLPGGARWLYALPGGDAPAALLAWLAGATVLMFLCGKAIGMTQGYVQAVVGSRMVNSLGAQVFDQLQRLSPGFHSRHTVADLMRRVTKDSNCVRGLLLGVLLPVITSAVGLALMFTVIWHLDRQLLLLALVAVFPLGVLIKLFTGPMTDRTMQRQRLEGEMTELAEQTLTALPVVKAFNREEHEDGRYRALSQRSVRAHLCATTSQLQFRIGAGAVTAVCTTLAIVIGGLHVLQGTMSVGGLLVFLAYLSSLYGAIESLAYAPAGVATASVGGRRVLEILETQDIVREAPDAEPLPVSPEGERGHVRLDEVTFGFEPGRPVLRGVSLEALPGQTVAIVGPTGAGKSTLVGLFLRFFDPWEGRVTVDGCDVRDLQLKSLRSRIALVQQEPFLLPLTVAENIAYARPEASRIEIEAAARAASADAFIERLPQGYDTLIGERGATLSGGERQRLSIARAFLKDAPILILDEPTSALDARTESNLVDTLGRLTKGRTTFIIAHRLSTIRRADLILVLADGRVAEAGTHRELMERGGIYSRFYEIHSGLPRSDTSLNGGAGVNGG